MSCFLFDPFIAFCNLCSIDERKLSKEIYLQFKSNLEKCFQNIETLFYKYLQSSEKIHKKAIFMLEDEFVRFIVFKYFFFEACLYFHKYTPKQKDFLPNIFPFGSFSLKNSKKIKNLISQLSTILSVQDQF